MAANANVALGITATNSTTGAFRAARASMMGLEAQQRVMASSMLRNRRLVQGFGMQLSDFSVQVAGGQSAILALTQQLPQFVQQFGAVGGVLAAVITIMGTVALVMYNTGTSMNALTPIAGVLASEFVMLADAMRTVGYYAIEFANLVVNNLDRILITVSMVVGFFASRWIVTMIRAAGAVAILTRSLELLRVALIRTGIGALIIGAGELIYQFLRLREAVGGVGNAVSALWDVFMEFGGRVADMFRVLGAVMTAAAAKFQAVFLTAINRVIGGFMEMTWQIADGLNTLFQTDMFAGAMLGEVTQELGRQATAADDAAAAAMGYADKLNASVTAPFKSVKALRDALTGLGDDDQIDIRDWFGGVEDAAKGAGGAAEKAAKQVETFGQAAGKIVAGGLDRLFDSMFEGGKDAIKILGDIGKELLKLVAKQQLFSVLGKLFPKTFGAGGMVDLSGSVRPFAKGGVVNGPTTFGMGGKRTGLMGEAGPEAILPLTRGPNGDLGVQAAGGAGGAGTMQVNIITPPGASVEQNERSSGGVTIRDIVIKEMKAATASGKMDMVNRQRYNVAPVPAKR